MGEVRIKRDVSDAIVYGIHINPNIQDPSNAVTYLEDAVGMTPASMGSTSFNAGSWADAFFIPKPCMVRYDGTVDYYLDPADYSKKADGTASDIADPNYGGNAMMEWGLIWFKFETGEVDGEGYFYVSNKKVDDSFNCWCNYDANNSVTQHFYTAIYNGTGTDKLRSISGVQLTTENGSGNTTGQQEITRATANNTSDMTEWYIDLWADRILLTGLLYLMGKSLNLQTTFGRGLDSGGQTVKESYVTGALNDKGLFWGATNSGNSAVKVFGMENFWGCAWRRTAGLFGTPTGYAYKLTHGTVDGSTVTEFGTNANGYIPVTVARPNDGYISKMLFGKHGMLPSAVGGTSSTYYSDYFYNGTGFSLVGGVSAHGSGCGFSVSLGNSVGVVSWSVVAALSLKPRAKTPYNPDWDNRPAHQYINGEWIDIPTHHYTNNRWQGELTSQSPLKFRADGDMLDWRVEGKTSENLYPILIGEDTWRDLNDATHSNNNGELVVVMSAANDSGVYSPSGSTIKTVHKDLSTYSWSVEIKADSPTSLIIGFEGDGLKYFNITTEYRKLTFSNQSFTSDRSFDIYNRTGVTRTVYLRNFMLNEGSTALPYEPYGGVGDWDETEQKYRIPVRVEGENLFDANSSSVDGYIDDNGNIAYTGYPIKTYDYINIIKDTDYTLVFNKTPSVSTIRIAWYDDEYNFIKRNVNSTGTYVIKSPSNASYCRLSIDVGLTNIRLLEGSYTTDTLPPYEVNLYTDHQLMDGDSIDYTTTETTIPLAMGNNTLSVDTAVQPKSVFVKFEG